MEILIQGKINGMEDVQRMFANCPTVLRNEILKWLLFENEKFIGTKKINGAIRNTLERKTTWINGQGWRKQVVNLFKGFVVDPVTNQQVSFKKLKAGYAPGTGVMGSGISMVLKMGMMYRNQKPIHAAIEALEESHTVSTNKYMPVPVKGLNLSKPYAKFQYWIKTGFFNVVYKNGMAFYFAKGKNGEKGKLMFVGKKNVNVKWRVAFDQSWSNRQSGVMPRGQAAVEKAIDKLKAM